MKKCFLKSLMLLSLFLMASVSAQAQAKIVVDDSDKNKINATVLEMLDQWDSQTYNTVAALLIQMRIYDTSELSAWGEQSLAAMKQAIENGEYKLLLRASGLTGKFKVVGDKWVKDSDADFLQFTFFDKNNKPCVAKLTSTGKKGTINIPIDPEDLEDAEEESSYGIVNSVMSKSKEIMQNVTMMEVEVPESMDFTFTYGDQTLLESKVIFNECAAVDDGFGILFSANALFNKINGDGSTFEFIINESGYMPEKGLNLEITTKKNGNSLLAMKLSAPGTFTGIDLNTLDFGFTRIDISLDVIGKVQVKGGVTDLTAFMQAMNSGDRKDEQSYKNAIAKANEYLDINLYYDGSATRKGYFALDAYQNDRGKWESRFVITFTSSNKSYDIKEYFSEENFPEVSAGVNALINEFKALIEAMKNKGVPQINGGDVDGNNVVDADDVVELVNYIAGNPSPGFVEAQADVNNDGVVNISDLVMLANYVRK
jgi:hypothetical protein